MSNNPAAPEPHAGRVVRPEKNGGTKIVRTTGQRWSQEAEETFLEELAATCNVSASAEACGFSDTAIYKRRMRDPGFAAAWAAALEQGYAKLEAMLVENATESLRREPIAGDRSPPAIGFNDALNLLKLHRASVRGGKPQRYAWRQQEPDIEDVRAEILRKVAAMERAREGQAAQGQEPSPLQGRGLGEGAST
jgi:hypothetical protein